MAWVDDRVWAHPKFTDLSAQAFRCYVYGLCYSSGFNTRGYLTEGQIATIGAKPSVRKELLEVGLWETRGKLILIHDWDEHNAKRDARREADRERKRLERLRKHGGRPPDSPAEVPAEVPGEVPQDAPSLQVLDDGMTDDRVTEVEPTPLPRRDELWDVLVTELGEPQTKSERGKRNKALKELRDIGATSGDLKRRIAAYRQKWPQLDVTATALTANWTLLGNNGQLPDRPWTEVMAEAEKRRDQRGQAAV